MDNNEVVTEEVAAVVENNTGIEIEPLFEEQVDFDTFSKSDFRVVKVKNCEAVPKSKKLLRFTLDDGTENERTILSGVHAFYEPEELEKMCPKDKRLFVRLKKLKTVYG